MRLLIASLFAGLVLSAQATTYKLVPVPLDNGYTLTGTIETDGSVGYLQARNFTAWSVVVTQTTDMVFTEKNTTAAQVTGVVSDGRKLHVPTSPDGFTDGGLLAFYGAGPRGGIPAGAVVADFTLNSQNIVGPGGAGGWQSELGLNLVSLGQPDATSYPAAVAVRGRPHVFHIAPVLVSTVTPVMKLVGTITTDGTLGPLAPANFRSWRLVGRTQESQVYTQVNSQILSADRVYADPHAQALVIDNPTGKLAVGVPMVSPRGSAPIIVTIGDFSDPAYPQGSASYYYGGFGLVAQKAPLSAAPRYVAARH